MRKLVFDLLQKRDGTEYFSDRYRMNPNRVLKRWALKKSHALRQCLSEPLGEETPKKKVGNCRNKEEREKKVVKVIDH
jgi:hypothetical protein